MTNHPASRKSKIHFILPLASLGILCACGGPSQNFQNESTTPTPGSSENSTPTTRTDSSSCSESRMQRWTFQQPEAKVYRDSDLLFVLDSSREISSSITRSISSALSDYSQALPPHGELRVAVMLGHGTGSPWSGRLYAPPGSPVVMSTLFQKVSRMEAQLKKTFSSPPSDSSRENGHALLQSLQASLAPGRLEEIRAQGFFREDAGLTIVIIATQDDPQSPENTLASLQALQGDRPLAVGALVSSLSKSPRIAELVNQASGITLEFAKISSKSLADPFKNLARQGTTAFKPLSEFTLSGDHPIISASLSVHVDGATVSANYDSSSRKVTIPTRNAGGPGSQVGIEACTE